MKLVKINKEVGLADPRLISMIYKKYYEKYQSCDHEEELSKINKDMLADLKQVLKFEQGEIEELIPESTQEIKEKNNHDFIKGILEVFSKKNYRIHATKSADSILEKGLLVRDENRDINYTSFELNDLTDNEILYKLYNEMHKFQKQIVVMDADSSDLVEYKNKFLLPSERIKLYIDLEKQEIIKNPNYKELGRSNDRKVTRENVEIKSESEKDIYLNQIEVFEKILKTDSREEIGVANTEIYSFINGIMSNLARGKISLKQDVFDKICYYVAQIDNDVYKSLKVIKKQEEEKQIHWEEKRQKESIQNSGLSMDATDDLF